MGGELETAQEGVTESKDHPKIGITLFNVDCAYFELGMYNKAEKTAKQSLAFFKRILPQNYSEIGRALSILASTYDQLERRADVLPLWEESLRLCKRALLKNHPKIGEYMCNLACKYFKLGMNDKDEKTVKQSLTFLKIVSPQNHTEIDRVLFDVY